MLTQNTNTSLKKINQYVFDTSQMIGCGYSSKVFQGIDKNSGNPCAVKIIQTSKIANKVEQQLLWNQTRALKQLNHPNIIKAFDILHTKSHYYIITPLYGQNLEDKQKKVGRFNQKEVFKIILKLVNVLCFLESKRIVHRDIKPSNIFQNQNDIILADFGFCAYTESGTLSEPGLNIGSPFYMSPEGYFQQNYTHKNDVWAVGMTALELLEGKRKFQGLKYQDMILRFKTPQYLKSLCISHDLRMILQKILNISADSRPTPTELEIFMHQKSQTILNSSIQKPIERNPIHSIHTSRQQPVCQFVGANQQRILTPSQVNNPKQNHVRAVTSFRTEKKSPSVVSHLNGTNFKSSKFVEKKVVINTVGATMQIMSSLLETFETDPSLNVCLVKAKLVLLLEKLCEKQIFNMKLTNRNIEDDYFHHVLQTIDWNCLEETSHYLNFLLKTSLMKETGNENQVDFHKNNRINLLKNLSLQLQKEKKSVRVNDNSEISNYFPSLKSLVREKSPYQKIL